MSRVEAINELIELFGGIPTAQQVDVTAFRYQVNQVLLEHVEYWIHITKARADETIREGFQKALNDNQGERAE